MRVAALTMTIARTPFTRRAWAELGFCLVGLPLALVGFAAVLVLLALGTGLTVSLIGAVLGLLLVVAATGLARGLGAAHRGLAAGLLRERVPPPPAFRPGSGVFGRLDARLRNAAAWRATAYVLLKLPLAAAGTYAALAVWVTAVFDLATPLRWARSGGEVQMLFPLPVGGDPPVTTFGGSLAAATVGAGMLLVAPWLTRAVVAADRWLIRALLGPGALAERVRDLEQSRALAVDDSAALLRRVERDLHDGAQVRLAAVAMGLDMARERLGTDPDHVADPARLRQLLDGAHRNAAEALAELRDLARGIHPPALDNGLAEALGTLAARSTVPVAVTVEVPVRPTPAIETIAYFCAAELLTNIIKHSDAHQAGIVVSEQAGRLRLRVTDDGHGGAVAGAGSGLTGLLQRVRTVDGTLEVSSPAGGPTAVTVDLPWHA